MIFYLFWKVQLLADKHRQPEWYNSEIMYARKMRYRHHAMGMWGEYRYWKNETKQIIDAFKNNTISTRLKIQKTRNLFGNVYIV